MISFTTSETENQPIVVKAVLDKDGDAALTIDGVTVAFLSARNGKIYCYYVPPASATRLRALGIQIENGFLVGLGG